MKMCNKKYCDYQPCLDARAALLRAKESLIRRMIPLASRLLHIQGSFGTTVSDLRAYALLVGELTGKEDAATLSALGHVFKRCRAVHTGQTRRSFLKVTHGVHQLIWYPDIRFHPQSV